MFKGRLAVALTLSVALSGSASADVNVGFLYRLSNFSGVLPYSDVQIHADRYHDEVYVGEGDAIRVARGCYVPPIERIVATWMASTEGGSLLQEAER